MMNPDTRETPNRFLAALQKLAGPRTFKATIIDGRAVFTCPLCRMQNSHSPEPGYRVSHCPCWRRVGYYIEV